MKKNPQWVLLVFSLNVSGILYLVFLLEHNQDVPVSLLLLITSWLIEKVITYLSNYSSVNWLHDLFLHFCFFLEVFTDHQRLAELQWCHPALQKQFLHSGGERSVCPDNYSSIVGKNTVWLVCISLDQSLSPWRDAVAVHMHIFVTRRGLFWNPCIKMAKSVQKWKVTLLAC